MKILAGDLKIKADIFKRKTKTLMPQITAAGIINSNLLIDVATLIRKKPAKQIGIKDMIN